jgi:hypothetical protein
MQMLAVHGLLAVHGPACAWEPQWLRLRLTPAATAYGYASSQPRPQASQLTAAATRLQALAPS